MATGSYSSIGSHRGRSSSAFVGDVHRTYAYGGTSAELADLSTRRSRTRLTNRSATSLANATIPEETSSELEGSNSSRQENRNSNRVFFKSAGSLRLLVWIVKLAMLAAVLACLVLSKLTMVEITGELYSLQRNDTKNANPAKSCLPYYWMLFLAVMIPDVLTWLYALCTGVLMNRSTHPWPSRRSLIMVSRNEKGKKNCIIRRTLYGYRVRITHTARASSECLGNIHLVHNYTQDQFLFNKPEGKVGLNGVCMDTIEIH